MWYFGEKIKNGGKTKSMEDIKSKYGVETIKTKSQNRLTQIYNNFDYFYI